MPTGAELSFGDFQLSSGERQVYFVLINTGSYTCTDTPLTAGPANGAALFQP
jgi:hypothetical protein